MEQVEEIRNDPSIPFEDKGQNGEKRNQPSQAYFTQESHEQQHSFKHSNSIEFNNIPSGAEVLSSKSQNSQSFIMDSSAYNLTSQQDRFNKMNHHRSTGVNNRGILQTNSFSHDTSAILNGSILDDTILKNQNIYGISGEEEPIKEEQQFQVKLNESALYEKPKPNNGIRLKPIEKVNRIQQQNPSKINKIEMTGGVMDEQIVVQIQNESGLTNSDKQSSLSNNSTLVQANCFQKLFRKSQLRSSVTFICGLYALFFIIQLFVEVGTGQSRACNAYRIGCQFQPAISNSVEIHRLFISSLLHASWLHIGSSIFTSLFYGFVLERNYGWKRIVMLYVTCGVGGNVFTGAFDEYEMQIGPSSIIMGILVLQGVFYYQIWRRIPKSKKKPLMGMYILLLALNLLCAIESSTVRISNYFGGLVTGGFLAFGFYKPRSVSQRLAQAQKASLFMVYILILGLFIYGMATPLKDIRVSDLSSCQN